MLYLTNKQKKQTHKTKRGRDLKSLPLIFLVYIFKQEIIAHLDARVARLRQIIARLA